MAFHRYRKAREAVDVNLVPVMNLFVVLIPFLLMSAAFYHVGVIPASFPSQTDGTSDVAEDTRQVTINLVVDREGIQLTAANAALAQDTMAGLSVSLPRKEGAHDLVQLQQALYAIKTQYPDSDTVILLPDPELPYQEIVRILDASRQVTLDKDLKTERKAPLFPVVVMSMLVKDPAAEAADGADTPTQGGG